MPCAWDWLCLPALFASPEDLTVDDFEVVQAGKKQIVNQFEFVKVPLGNREIPSGTAALDDLPPATNGKPARDSRLFAIVIDDGTLLPPDIVATKLLIQQFVQRTQPNDVMSLTYVNRSDLSQDFTRDPARITRAADRVSAALGSGSATGDPVGGSIRRADDLATVGVLSNVVKVLSTAREPRRAILLVGRGTYIQKGPHWPEWWQFYRDASEAGVPVYTLHAGGLMAPELGLDLPLERQTTDAVRIIAKSLSAGVVSLQEIATNTGGRSFVNRTNIGTAIEEMLSENGSYYVIGFEPNPSTTKRFQSVEVSVRRPGVSVRARKGYMSGPRAATANADRLAVRLAEGTPGGDLALSGLAVRSSPDAEAVIAIVDIDPADVSPLGDEIEFEWIALDPDAKVTGRGTARLNVPSEATRGSRGIVIVARLAASPRSRVVRVGISSVTRRAAGWIHLQLEPLRSRGEDYAASPVFLSQKGANAPSVAIVGDVQAVLPLTPSSRRTFSADDVLRVFCRFVALPKATPVTLRVLRATDQREMLTTAPSITLVGNLADAMADVPLASLAPGEYRIEVLAGTGVHQTRRATLVTVR